MLTSYIALLRGVNVGGAQKVPMSELRAMVDGLGFADTRTLLNSGNVVFRSERKTTPAALESLLEIEAAKRLGLKTDFHVRTAEVWREVITANPLTEAARDDPGHLVVMCLKSAPAAAAVEALRAAVKGREVIHAVGRQLYIAYPDGIGESRLTAPLMDAKLATRGTGRNWNTVLKLAVLAGA